MTTQLIDTIHDEIFYLAVETQVMQTHFMKIPAGSMSTIPVSFFESEFCYQKTWQEIHSYELSWNTSNTPVTEIPVFKYTTSAMISHHDMVDKGVKNFVAKTLLKPVVQAFNKIDASMKCRGFNKTWAFYRPLSVDMKTHNDSFNELVVFSCLFATAGVKTC